VKAEGFYGQIILKTAITLHNVNTSPPHPQPFSLREKGESSLSFWERAGVRGKIWPCKKLLQKHYFQLPFLG
jgi:hypothetical protein